jgi:hypothetical protein
MTATRRCAVLRAVFDRMQAGTAAWMRIPERRQWLLASGFELTGTIPEKFRRLQQAEMAVWGDVVRSRHPHAVTVRRRCEYSVARTE